MESAHSVNQADRLRAVLQGRRVTPAMPPRRRARVVNCDAEAGARNGRDHSASWAGFFKYTNGKGEVSERRIICIALEGVGEVERFRGRCVETDAFKCFRVDRVSELMDLSTGEFLDPASHFEELRRTGALAMRDKALEDIARVLVFLARCDGEHHPLEAAALEDAFGRYAFRFGGYDHELERAMQRCVGLAPDDEDVAGAVDRFGRLDNGAAIARFVLDQAGKVIDADGRHADEEIRWAIEIGDALKAVAVSR